MATWVNEILDAFYEFEHLNKAICKTMEALEEIPKYMTPKEIKAFFN